MDYELIDNGDENPNDTSLDAAKLILYLANDQSTNTELQETKEAIRVEFSGNVTTDAQLIVNQPTTASRFICCQQNCKRKKNIPDLVALATHYTLRHVPLQEDGRYTCIFSDQDVPKKAKRIQCERGINSDLSALRKHINIHIKSEQRECIYCNSYKTARNWQLNQHIQKNHPGAALISGKKGTIIPSKAPADQDADFSN